jgi:hypothetical protein
MAADDVIHHYGHNKTTQAACGAERFESGAMIQGKWADVTCLGCIVAEHPLPGTRKRAAARLRELLPPSRSPEAIETWLAT